MQGDSSHSCDYSQRYLLLSSWEKGPTFYIIGKSDDAIAQTAAYFLNLEESTLKNNPYLLVRFNRTDFDFRAAGDQCLQRLMDTVPSFQMELNAIKLSVAQSVALATRPQPMWLYMSECIFEDKGTAFVDALKMRTAAFGSLAIDCDALNDENLKLLLDLEVLDHLELPILENDELALLPLTAKVESLDYCIFSASALDTDLSVLNIVAKKLCLSVGIEDEFFPTDLMVSFWRRVAELGHFLELDIKFYGSNFELPDYVVQELIRAAHSNINLQVLCLSDCEEEPFWGPYLQKLFNGLKDHKRLRTLKAAADQEDFGPNYCFLRAFFS
ncbi:hypothetical protein FisN_2HuN07 [Fistulifera solaris]|uniref:Uncharacterized protein n=1 Tax=Fistulifera solaris TaxID=1519565 RepID=A0A1Z5JG71_FISSO|nr:hypothetical protein FisN_2HuN07 [Fistulifera solaris]|eukprot:GAX13005.1 hypothetical protein FisN_2HuN07 [Fistulifera solaris]